MATTSPASTKDGSTSTLQQLVNDPRSTQPAALNESEVAARQAMEAKQRERFAAHMEQQRQKEINKAHMDQQRQAARAAQLAQAAQAAHSSHAATDSDATMPLADSLTEKDPWIKDTQNERDLKKRQGDEEDCAEDPTKVAGSDCLATVSRLLQHNKKLEQPLNVKLTTIWQITQTSMNEFGSRIDDIRETTRAGTDSLKRRMEQIAVQVERNKQALEPGAIGASVGRTWFRMGREWRWQGEY